jgi:hypothetical protein
MSAHNLKSRGFSGVPSKAKVMRAFPNSGAVRSKVIIAQLIVVAGLIAWFKYYLPKLQRERAASEALERERKINTFFRWAVIEDRSRPEVDLSATAGGEGRSYPQRLRRNPSLEEMEQILGAPDGHSTDFRGGLHESWTGTGHKLEASFDKDRLYTLKLEDRRTGHGVMVFDSSWQWHPF